MMYNTTQGVGVSSDVRRGDAGYIKVMQRNVNRAGQFLCPRIGSLRERFVRNREIFDTLIEMADQF